MLSLLSSLHKDRLRNFKNGIHPPDMKSQSSNVPLCSVPLSDKLIIPLKQHLGPEGELQVVPGDNVLRGQSLTAGSGRAVPVHAPTSGTIAEITLHRIAHPSGLAEPCIILLPDGKDQWITLKKLVDFQRYSSVQLLNHIHESGIVGLGGAGFPTAAKLIEGKNKIKTLIVNGAECEPYITADDRLIREHASEIITGIGILHHILQPQSILLGIENNKINAISALKEELVKKPISKLCIIPTKYPSGDAKQLIKILTGKEVPAGYYSTSIGIVVLNIGTVYAIKRAVINGESLTERVVTLTGKALSRPGNVWVRLGTPVNHLLAYAGFTPTIEKTVIMGGSLMGFILPVLDVPIIKTSNCLLAPSIQELAQIGPEQSCIRCGRCADVCPVNLLPQQLYWFSRGQEYDKARQYHLFDCIECGACAYVCPSHIPLVHYYRKQKAKIYLLDNKMQRSMIAKARYTAKLNRRKKEKQQKLTYRQKFSTSLTFFSDEPVSKDTSLQTAVTEAITRAKSRRHPAQQNVILSDQISSASTHDADAVLNKNVAVSVLATPRLASNNVSTTISSLQKTSIRITTHQKAE